MWKTNQLTEELRISHPILLGPFGGGLSSPSLTAAVSNEGGLGSFGAQGMTTSNISTSIKEIRSLTSAPFAINLWVSTRDTSADSVSEAEFQSALLPLLPFYNELGVTPPTFPLPATPSFEEQFAAVLEDAPPVFSFIFGVPKAEILAACRERSIYTIGTATTVTEALALEEAGVNAVVATGFEAGGHRPSFLRSAEASLSGTISLVPQVVGSVDIPVIAAGGICDGRAVVAALALGAQGVQVGTAFLACKESNAIAAHRGAILTSTPNSTVLTRSFTGRLARGFPNLLSKAIIESRKAPLPYPLQSQLVGPLRQAAIEQERFELISLWAGQSAPLTRHDSAKALFNSLVEETEATLTRLQS